MLKVQAGELEKLGILYERYKKRIFGFFYHMHGNISLSEDLTQNVFMRVLKYKHTYAKQNSFTSWIFQIARNVNIDQYGKSKKKPDHVSTLTETRGIMTHDDIHAQIVMGEDLSTLQKALDSLNTEKRAFLVLSKFKELRYKEVGEIMGCTEGAARTKVHRALHELKEIFLQLEKR